MNPTYPNDYTKESFSSHLEEKGLADSFNEAISNCDILNTVDQYYKVREFYGDCVMTFASNGGGFSTYHYYKESDNMYIITGWMQDITSIYRIDDNSHIEKYENILKRLS